MEIKIAGIKIFRLRRDIKRTKYHFCSYISLSFFLNKAIEAKYASALIQIKQRILSYLVDQQPRCFDVMCKHEIK